MSRKQEECKLENPELVEISQIISYLIIQSNIQICSYIALFKKDCNTFLGTLQI